MVINRVIIFIFFSLSIIFSIDSDRDGYSDKLELELGTDPDNIESRYYYGYWPFNMNKDSIKGSEIPIHCPFDINSLATPPSPPPTPGFFWGALGATCDETCTLHGLTCNEASAAADHLPLQDSPTEFLSIMVDLKKRPFDGL